MRWVIDLVCAIGMVALLGVTATVIVGFATVFMMGFAWVVIEMGHSVFEFMMGAMR